MCQKYSVKWKKKSRNNLPKIKGETYIINPDEYELIGTYWVALYVETSKNATYFDSVEVEHIPLPPQRKIRKRIKEKKPTGNTNITTNFLEYKHTIQ